jgi:hypothetical protein
MEKLSKRDSEIQKNYDVFKTWLPSLIIKHGYGKYALIRQQKLINVFDTKEDALKAAELKFDDGLFSIQEITDIAINLGFYSSIPCHQ